MLQSEADQRLLLVAITIVIIIACAIPCLHPPDSIKNLTKLTDACAMSVRSLA